MTLEKFDILEEKVGQLAERFAQLRNEKDDILQSMKEKEKVLVGLEERTQSLEEERDQIRARLDKVIATLEKVSVNI